MDSFINHLEPIFRQLINLIMIIFVMAFLIRPLLNYFTVNREIEHRKRLVKELRESRCEFDEDDDVEDTDGSMTDRESLQRLAADSPEEAHSAVKKMLHEEE